jgi:hypothetical protein
MDCLTLMKLLTTEATDDKMTTMVHVSIMISASLCLMESFMKNRMGRVPLGTEGKANPPASTLQKQGSWRVHPRGYPHKLQRFEPVRSPLCKNQAD